MDYCSSCRRHLNGALVCPGCGAYAPDIAPPVSAVPVFPARPALVPPDVPTAPAGTWEPGAGPARTHGAAGDSAPSGRSADEADGVTDSGAGREDHGSDGDPMPALAQGGRAARRRQLARWRKSHRRAVVATAVALVGGGLTFASMDRGSSGTGRAQAAKAPDESSMGGVSEEAAGDAAAADGRAGSPSGSPESSGESGSSGSAKSSTGAAGSSSGTGRRAGSGNGDGSPSASASREEFVSVGRGTSRGPVPVTGSGSGKSGSSDTGGANGTNGKTSAPPSSAPSQQPSTSPATQEPSGGSGSQSGSADPTEDPTSPSQLCLLVVCLG